MTDTQSNPGPQSGDQQSTPKFLAILMSLAALAITYYAAQQSARAAKANEQIAALSQKQTIIAQEQSMIAHEQTRPRLVFSDVVVSFNADFIVVHASIMNMGNAPAMVKSAIFTNSQAPCAVEAPFNNISQAIIYPGWSRKVTVWPRRKRRVQGQPRYDCVKTDPAQFGFAVDYELYQHSDIAFHESLRVPNLRWPKQ